MAEITIQIVEGLERGRTYERLDTPVTIGREEDNSIQLNDERVSRFHSKIQDDSGHVILTDLDSTNGTRVNGRPVQLRVLQPGDQLSIGRCLLIFGSPEEITARLEDDGLISQQATTPVIGLAADATLNLVPEQSQASSFDDQELINLFPCGPPQLPETLTGLQQAQLSDLISFAHDRIASILSAARSSEPTDQEAIEAGTSPGGDDAAMVVRNDVWQRLLELEMQLAVYLRSIAEPDQARSPAD